MNEKDKFTLEVALVLLIILLMRPIAIVVNTTEKTHNKLKEVFK